MSNDGTMQELKNRFMQISFGPLDLAIYNTVCMSQASLQLRHSHPYFEIHLPLKGNAMFLLDGGGVAPGEDAREQLRNAPQAVALVGAGVHGEFQTALPV